MSIMKVVFLGKSKRKTGNTNFMFKALQRRVESVVFINVPRYRKIFFWTDYRKIILAKILKAKPDLVLIYSKDIPYTVLSEIRSIYKTAIFYPDVCVPLNDELVKYARLTDYLFITNKGQLAELESLKIRNPIFCMQGCDRDRHHIIPTRKIKWVSEVAFIGGRMDIDYRVELLQAINQCYNLKVWGDEWQKFGLTCLKKHIYPKEYAKICYAAKIILGCDAREEIECNTSNRTWITLGCGGFLLTRYIRGMETVFTKGVHLEWFHSQEECLSLIDYYLKHDEERKKIARNGYQFAHATRTYDVVMDEIISRIENDETVIR